MPLSIDPRQASAGSIPQPKPGKRSTMGIFVILLILSALAIAAGWGLAKLLEWL